MNGTRETIEEFIERTADLFQSGDEEELLTIKDEEVKVRNLIQETLVKSDELSVSIDRVLIG